MAVKRDGLKLYFDRIEELQALVQFVGPIPDNFEIYVSGEKIR